MKNIGPDLNLIIINELEKSNSKNGVEDVHQSDFLVWQMRKDIE